MSAFVLALVAALLAVFTLFLGVAGEEQAVRTTEIVEIQHALFGLAVADDSDPHLALGLFAFVAGASGAVGELQNVAELPLAVANEGQRGPIGTGDVAGLVGARDRIRQRRAAHDLEGTLLTRGVDRQIGEGHGPDITLVTSGFALSGFTVAGTLEHDIGRERRRGLARAVRAALRGAGAFDEVGGLKERDRLGVAVTTTADRPADALESGAAVLELCTKRRILGLKIRDPRFQLDADLARLLHHAGHLEHLGARFVGDCGGLGRDVAHVVREENARGRCFRFAAAAAELDPCMVLYAGAQERDAGLLTRAHRADGGRQSVEIGNRTLTNAGEDVARHETGAMRRRALDHFDDLDLPRLVLFHLHAEPGATTARHGFHLGDDRVLDHLLQNLEVREFIDGLDTELHGRRAQGRLDLVHLAATQEANTDDIADRLSLQCGDESLDRLHFLAVDPDDDVTRLQPGSGRGGAVDDALDSGTLTGLTQVDPEERSLLLSLDHVAQRFECSQLRRLGQGGNDACRRVDQLGRAGALALALLRRQCVVASLGVGARGRALTFLLDGGHGLWTVRSTGRLVLAARDGGRGHQRRNHHMHGLHEELPPGRLVRDRVGSISWSAAAARTCAEIRYKHLRQLVRENRTNRQSVRRFSSGHRPVSWG